MSDSNGYGPVAAPGAVSAALEIEMMTLEPLMAPCVAAFLSQAS